MGNPAVPQKVVKLHTTESCQVALLHADNFADNNNDNNNDNNSNKNSSNITNNR